MNKPTNIVPLKDMEMKKHPYAHYNGRNKPITGEQIEEIMASAGVYPDKDGFFLWDDIKAAAKRHGVEWE